MESLKFKLDVFEGPLDLLLALIAKNKVDISDIPIALILEQYMAVLDEMRSIDTDVSGEFIVMAAELMRIKSRMLLPRPADEEKEDPRAGLARALLEYQQAKEHAVLLRERYAIYAARIVKDTAVIDTSHDTPTGLDAAMLSKAMNRILERNRNLPRLARESEQAIRRLLEAKTVPVSAQITYVSDVLQTEGTRSFEDLILRCSSHSELIATFLAILELIRSQQIHVRWPEEGEEEDAVLFTWDPGAEHPISGSEFEDNERNPT